MYRFITSLLLLISSVAMNAQLFNDLEPGRQPFVRISVDPTVRLKTFMQNAKTTGFEVTVDSEIKQNLFLSGGFGRSMTNQDIESFQYTNNGYFLNGGANLNLTKYRKPTDRDIFFVGLHYGFSRFTQEAPRIELENAWGKYSTSVDKERLSASWVEVAMGLKAEVAKNIFIGWTGEAKILSHVGSSTIEPYNIPGFGKNDSAFSFDFNFFISYAISFKPKKQPVATEDTL